MEAIRADEISKIIRQQIEGYSTNVEVNEVGVDLAMRQHKAGNITDLDLANQQAAFQ